MRVALTALRVLLLIGTVSGDLILVIRILTIFIRKKKFATSETHTGVVRIHKYSLSSIQQLEKNNKKDL